MEETRNFITKRELDALYDKTLWLMSEKFFGVKKNVWDDVLPAAAEILSSEDFDNNAWILLQDWENEIKMGLPSKSIDDMSEEEIKKYSKENQPIVEVFKRSVKLYILFSFFCTTGSSKWDVEMTPQEKVKYRIKEYIQKIAVLSESILSNKQMISEIERCCGVCQDNAIGKDYPVYDVERFWNISLEGLCDETTKITMDNGNSDILVMKELLKEKDEEIERLKKELSEKEQTIKELKENNLDSIEFCPDIEQLPCEKPRLSVRVFVLHELLRNYGCDKYNKRAIALFAMLLLGLDGARALASKNTVLPKKGESYILEDNDYGKEIKLFNAVLKFGLNVDDKHLFKTKQESVDRVCQARIEDYDNLISRYINPNKNNR